MNLQQAIDETGAALERAKALPPNTPESGRAYRQYLNMRPIAQKAFEQEYGARKQRHRPSLQALYRGQGQFKRGETPVAGYFFDHAEAYNLGGRPWAVVSHTYERNLDGFIRRLRDDYGLFVFELPGGVDGWYNPGDAWTFITARLDEDIPHDWHIALASIL